MLSRKYRFRGLGSVRPAMLRGQTARDSGGKFTVKALKARPGRESRAAVVISRRTAKSAVERNRLRRRIYEILREAWSELPGPADIVVIVHDIHLAELSHTELKQRLKTTLKAAISRTT